MRDDSLARWGERLAASSARIGTDFPGEGPDRQPVHTVYGGAHLFGANTSTRLGELALAALDRWAPTPAHLVSVLEIPDDLAVRVHGLVRAKLAPGNSWVDVPRLVASAKNPTVL